MKNKKISKVKKITYTALLFALACVLSIAENMLMAPLAMPGIKLGLANVVVMFAVFFLGKGLAVELVVLKAIFNALIRGPIAGATSLAGGLFSIIIILTIYFISKKNASYFILSIAGAIFHNIGQIFVISFVLDNLFTFLYIPILLISGVVMGSVTAVVLKILIPYIKRLGLNNNL